MTREEEKTNVSKEYGLTNPIVHQHGMIKVSDVVRPANDFLKGIEWADEHPKSQWRKVEEFPPEDPKHKGWSVKVIVINDGQYDIGFYDYKLKRWCVPGCINPYFTNITHWQTFPELPKEI
jgi:hypothetical protein